MEKMLFPVWRLWQGEKVFEKSGKTNVGANGSSPLLRLNFKLVKE